jgi:hypothetical protein
MLVLLVCCLLVVLQLQVGSLTVLVLASGLQQAHETIGSTAAIGAGNEQQGG